MTEYELIAKTVAKPLLKESLPVLKKISKRVTHFFSDHIYEYYKDKFEQYKNTKTLLYRQPTNFYEIYFPLKLTCEGELINTWDINEVFANHSCVTLIGDAGSGKSTLIKHLFMSSVCSGNKLPVLIFLRDMDIEHSDLELYIRKYILRNKLAADDESLTKLLKNGDFLFFLDGYDEIDSKEKSRITKNLESFVENYNKNYFMLSSRPYSNIESFKNFYNYTINELNKNDVEEFIKKQIKDTRLSNKIIESIKGNISEHIESFLKNPLLLTLYIITYSKNSKIPSSKYIFYRRVFDVLFSEHDSSSKIGFEREIKSNLSQEQFESILEIYSFISYFSDTFNFDKKYIFDQLTTIKQKVETITFTNNDFISDMVLSIGIWSEDTGEYSFSHRSLQEYFAAIYLSKLDSENRKKVYRKVLTKGRATAGRDRFTNFLSLCYEVDKLTFIESYSLVSISSLKDLFINNKGRVNYSLSYLKGGFSKGMYGGSKDFRIVLARSIYPSFNALKYVNSINELILKNEKHKDFLKYFKVEKRNTLHNYLYTPKSSIEKIDGYSDFVSEIGLDKEYLNIIEAIDSYIKEMKDELKLLRDNQKDFINMI